MQIHLSDCRSPVRARQALGRNKLDLCLAVLQSLQDTYWSASVTHRLFERAADILSGHTRPPTRLPSPVPAVLPSTHLSIDSTTLAELDGLLNPDFCLPDDSFTWFANFVGASGWTDNAEQTFTMLDEAM